MFRPALNSALVAVILLSQSTISYAETNNEKVITVTEISAKLKKLKQENEQFRTGYDRKLFKHWIDADKDKCDTRREVLARQSLTSLADCRVSSGKWLSVYDNKEIYNASDLDIDHVVSLAEAWDSGAKYWTASQRETFANDLDSPWALVAVTKSSNRSKSDKDPSEFAPVNKKGLCFLAVATIIVKEKYSLSVDGKEHNALRSALNNCKGDINQFAPRNLTQKNEINPPTNPTINPTTNSDQDQTPPVSDQPYYCPATHPIKGNISNERIYHIPSSPYYQRTKPEVCFSSELAAQNANFRPPR